MPCADNLACLQSIEALLTVTTSSTTSALTAIHSHVDYAQLGSSPAFMSIIGVVFGVAFIAGIKSA